MKGGAVGFWGWVQTLGLLHDGERAVGGARFALNGHNGRENAPGLAGGVTGAEIVRHRH